MATNQANIPPEVRVTVELLLDTESKIEKLQSELKQHKVGGSSRLELNPPGSSFQDKQNLSINRRSQIISEIADLKNRTIGIATEIEKASPPDVRPRVSVLVNEWKKEMEAEKVGSDKDVSSWQKGFNRMLNTDWKALETPEKPQTPFSDNHDDISRAKDSYMDKVRGLNNQYAYLKHDNPQPGIAVDTPGEQKTEIEGPELDLE